MSKSIFLVDDDPVIRMLISEYLGNFGHQVEVLENGRCCLERLQEKLPDLVLVDLQMPDMTGFDVIQSMRKNPSTADIPIALLSANSERDAKAAAPENVVPDRYLQKPFELPEILKAIEELTKAPD